MDEVPDTALDLARLVDELTVLDQRRVDIGESLVHLEYLYSQMAHGNKQMLPEKLPGEVRRTNLRTRRRPANLKRGCTQPLTERMVIPARHTGPIGSAVNYVGEI